MKYVIVLTKLNYVYKPALSLWLQGGLMPINSNPTVRQHQVQQKYLEAWCNANHQLWIYRKEDRKQFLTNTANAFLRKAYYKLKPINDQERIILLSWVGEPAASSFVSKKPIRTIPDIINSMAGILKEWEKVKNQKKDLFQHSIDLLIFYSSSLGVIKSIKSPVEADLIDNLKSISDISMQSIESYYCGIEEAGMPIITKILNNETIDSDDMQDLTSYVCVQYFRTSDIGSIIENSSTPQFDVSNIRPILQILLGMRISDSMNTKQSDIQLIENNSSVPFFTGSQPVINILAVPGQRPEELQFYFPISPELALLVTPDGSKQYSKKQISDASAIDVLNLKIISNSEVIATKERDDINRYSLLRI